MKSIALTLAVLFALPSFAALANTQATATTEPTEEVQAIDIKEEGQPSQSGNTGTSEATK